jgi:hypothetical protein
MSRPSALATIPSEAQGIAERVLAARANRPEMETVKDFFAAFDQKVGGSAEIAGKLRTCIDGLINSGEHDAAGTLMLQLQRLRLQTEKQKVEEDLGLLTLAEKRLRLEAELAQFLEEQRKTAEVNQNNIVETTAISAVEGG